jgi:hypothetical protein
MQARLYMPYTVIARLDVLFHSVIAKPDLSFYSVIARPDLSGRGDLTPQATEIATSPRRHRGSSQRQYVGEGLVPSLQRVHNSPYPSYLKTGTSDCPPPRRG